MLVRALVSADSVAVAGVLAAVAVLFGLPAPAVAGAGAAGLLGRALSILVREGWAEPGYRGTGSGTAVTISGLNESAGNEPDKAGNDE